MTVLVPRGSGYTARRYTPFYTTGFLLPGVGFVHRDPIVPRKSSKEFRIELNEPPGWTPEQRLCGAILIRAVKDLEAEEPHVRRHARQWFNGEGDYSERHVFSFPSIAKALDRNPDELWSILASRGLFDT